MRRFLFIALLCLPFAAIAQREIQDNTGWSLKDRIYLGGGLSFNGGTDGYNNRFFYFALNPIVGYMITPQLSSGMGFQWQHYEYPDINETIDQYGFSPFLRYNFGKLFTYAEYNIMNSQMYFNSSDRQNFSRLLLGVGYSQPLGPRGAVHAMGLYDVIYKVNGPFASPWVFRVYFSF